MTSNAGGFVLRFKVGDPRDYNLELTLKPSFVSSLYAPVGEASWHKQAGLYAGFVTVRQVDDFVEAFVAREVGEDVSGALAHELGLWDEKPSQRVSKLRGELKEQVRALTELFPGLRLSIAPHDFNCIFIAVALSKRTRYEVFVRKWVKELWDRWRCDPITIASLKPEELKCVGTSYQLADLVKTLRDYVRLGLDVRGVALEDLRRALMSCWGVGPKVADATLLFATRSSWIVPCDTHLQRVSKRLGWIEKGVRMPNKALCLSLYCDECVDRLGPCLKVEIEGKFRGFGGWVQTLTYLFGSAICTSSSPKCSYCHDVLRDYCRERASRARSQPS
jgi:endonuclease III